MADAEFHVSLNVPSARAIISLSELPSWYCNLSYRAIDVSDACRSGIVIATICPLSRRVAAPLCNRGLFIKLRSHKDIFVETNYNVSSVKYF